MSNCLAITAFFPSITSKMIFAPRRADKSIESDCAPVTVMNAGVAALQLSKIGEGIVAIAKDTGNTTGALSENISGSLREISKSNSIFSDINKLTNNITKHVSINNAIGLATLGHALSQEDKESALIQDGCMYGGMLAFEGAHKMLFGSSNSKRVDGINTIEVKDGLYRKSGYLSNKADSFVAFCEKQEEALKDCGAIKKFIGKAMKYLPAGIKGLTFAGFSIGGSALCYELGGEIAEKVTGRKVA